MPLPLTDEEIQRRIDIIKASRTIEDAAQVLGMKCSSVATFAHRQKVKPKEKKKPIPKTHRAIGIPMEKALDADKCYEMRKFLQTLVKVANHGKVDINKFFKAYLEIRNGAVMRRTTKVTQDMIEQMRELHKSKKSREAIAEMFGVSKATVFINTRNI